MIIETKITQLNNITDELLLIIKDLEVIDKEKPSDNGLINKLLDLRAEVDHAGDDAEDAETSISQAKDCIDSLGSSIEEIIDELKGGK